MPKSHYWEHVLNCESIIVKNVFIGGMVRLVGLESVLFSIYEIR